MRLDPFRNEFGDLYDRTSTSMKNAFGLLNVFLLSSFQTCVEDGWVSKGNSIVCKWRGTGNTAEAEEGGTERSNERTD